MRRAGLPGNQGTRRICAAATIAGLVRGGGTIYGGFVCGHHSTGAAVVPFTVVTGGGFTRLG